MPIRSLLLAGVALAAASAAHAQTSRDDDAMPANIIVTAPMAQSEADVLSGTSIVSGAALTRTVKPHDRPTHAHPPGVTASSFGPTPSRPLLPGLQSDRVRVHTARIST